MNTPKKELAAKMKSRWQAHPCRALDEGSLQRAAPVAYRLAAGHGTRSEDGGEASDFSRPTTWRSLSNSRSVHVECSPYGADAPWPCYPKIGTTQSSSLAVIEVQRSAKPSMTTDGIGIRCHGGGQLD